MRRMRVVQVGPKVSRYERRVRITWGPWTALATVTIAAALRAGHLRALLDQHRARIQAQRRRVRR